MSATKRAASAAGGAANKKRTSTDSGSPDLGATMKKPRGARRTPFEGIIHIAPYFTSFF